MTRWNGATFDLCRAQLIAAGVGLVSGKESPVIEDIAFTDLPTPTVGVGATTATKRIDVPLKQGDTVARLSVDITVMSAHSSALLTVVEHFPTPAPQNVRDATLNAMAAKLRS